MARPEEKAMAMLNKWQSMKEDHDSAQTGATDRSGKRPYLSSLCLIKSDAEFWRKQIIQEISKGVADIQNEGMQEHQVRDLNDRINKLLREKFHWNKRIKELGGADYNKLERSAAASAVEEEGGESAVSLGGSNGYKYFGAARNLPGVKELFVKAASDIMKRSRGDVYKQIDTRYYGFVDEEDGVIVQQEREEEERRVREVRKKRVKIVGRDEDEGWKISVKDMVTNDSNEGGGAWHNTDVFGGLSVQVPMPSRELIDKAKLDAKKKALLDAFE
jgi:pre-mRNA-splicing factor ISY1